MQGVSLVNIYRKVCGVGFEYCCGCLKETLGRFLWRILLFLPELFYTLKL